MKSRGKPLTIHVLGEANSGKSSLIQAYCDPGKQHINPVAPLKGLKKKQIAPTSDEHYRDIHLIESVQSLASPADITLILVDLSKDRQTICDEITQWVKEVHSLHPDNKIMIVGTKPDLVSAEDQKDKATIMRERAEDANECPYFEVNNLTGENIDKLFQYCIHVFESKKPFHTASSIQEEIDNINRSQARERISSILRTTRDVEQLANKITLINEITGLISGPDYKGVRAQIRNDIEASLALKIQADLANKKHETRALNRILDEVAILQGKGGLLKDREKTAKIRIKKLSNTVTHHENLSGFWDVLIADDSPSQPITAMQYIAQAPEIDEARLKKLISKHLVKKIESNVRETLATKMTELSRDEKTLLKSRLLQVCDELNPGTQKTLHDQAAVENSHIPFIEILRISGSGRINHTTNSYTTFLGKMGVKPAHRRHGLFSSLSSYVDDHTKDMAIKRHEQKSFHSIEETEGSSPKPKSKNPMLKK